MGQNNKELPIEIYHRIYRLAVKKASPDQIAYTLNIPIGLVKNIIKHFRSKTTTAQKNNKPTTKATVSVVIDEKNYLDVYVISRLKFSILDLNGMIVENNCTNLQIAFDKMLRSDQKAVALLMKNVKEIDDFGISTLLDFHKAYVNKGRYTAILDPNIKTEEYLIKNEIENSIEIYGTEKAFEDKALKSMKQK